ncbi:MAG: phosphatidylglycerophosphatase A [Hydrogenophilus sp.]|nr:phosphatidylglycerophosphatase A [Hydrogenophilus sp.]
MLFLPPPRRAQIRSLLRRNPFHLLSFGFGIGFLSPAPGTLASLLAWALWPLLTLLPPFFLLLTLTLATLFALLFTPFTAHALNHPDPSEIVWDEITAFWWLLYFAPPDPLAQLLALFLFRLFDIAKPWPIALLEQKLPTGPAILLDDLLAALYAFLLLTPLTHLPSLLS